VTAEWVRLARSKDVTIEESTANVLLAERSHRVSITDEGGAFRLRAVVARPAAVATMTDPVLFAWSRNRASRLVGFRVDERGRLIGECLVPKTGVTPAEFQLYLRTLAAESDRLEHLVTGKDVE
jgi:hypothetical protein